MLLSVKIGALLVVVGVDVESMVVGSPVASYPEDTGL